MDRKTEIANDLEYLWLEVSEFMNRIGSQAAHAHPYPDVWTISNEFDHMILSAAPIAKVLNLGADKFDDQNLPNRIGLTYDSLEEWYWETLRSRKVQAPSRYVGDESSKPNLEDQCFKWETTGKGLIDGLGLWDEQSIDRVQLKHPLLSYLTMREMLFFTHIHTTHHFNSIHRKASFLSTLN